MSNYNTKKRLRLYSAFFFFSVLLLYLSFLSKLYNFDGVACAMAIELGDPEFLFHGNHLLYGFLGFLFHHLLNGVGLHIRSIISLQIMNCILGAFSSVLFFRLIYRLTHHFQLSIFSTLGMAFSFGFWLWHTEAQVYPLGFVFLISATFILWSQNHRRKKYVWVGVLHCLACLGHIAHSIWIPVVLHRIYVENKSKPLGYFLKNISYYLASLFIPLLCAYGAVVIMVIKPQTAGDCMQFLSGSAAISGTFSWPLFPGLERIKSWLFTEGHTFYGHDLQNTVWAPATNVTLDCLGSIFRILSKISVAIVGIWGLIKIKEIYRDNKLILTECGIWIVVYALFFSAWEPGNITYHHTDLIPWWIVITFVFNSISGSVMKLTASAAFVTVLFINNFYGAIYPLSKVSRNPLLSKMSFIRETSGPHDLIIIEGGWDRVYVPYFACRKYVSVNYHRNILAETAHLFSKRGFRVYAYSDILSNNTLQQSGLFYTIKKNYTMDETFSLTEIIPK